MSTTSPAHGALLAYQANGGNNMVLRMLRTQQAPSNDVTVQRSPAGQAVIDRFENLGGLNLKEEELGAELARMLPSRAAEVADVFDTLSDHDRDDVAVALVEAVPSQADLASKAAGCEWLFRKMVGYLQEGETEDDEATAIERLTRAASPSHDHLANESWATSPGVTAAEASQGASLQSQTDGSGDLIFDEYSVIMDAMPPGLTAEAYLQEMAGDLNAAVHSEAFDAINTFHRRPRGPAGPATGDIYHIDIAGPDNGSVMLVESTPDHFIFQTVMTAEDGTHPEYGSRQFGFEHLPGGSVRWYTRGASRPGLTPMSGTVGRHAQEAGWTRMLKGIAATLVSRGGTERAGTFQSWTTHRDDATASGTW